MADPHLHPSHRPTPPAGVPLHEHGQQQAAANLARNQLDHIYQHAPPNQLNTAVAPQEASADPYNHTYNQETGATEFNLENYHSAWQQYYQQYYHHYYSQQLEAHRQQDSNLQAHRAAEAQASAHIIGGSDPASATPSEVQALKNRLLGTVKQRAGQVRSSHHFVPIVSALVVGILFLFLQYNRIFFAQVKAYVSPGSVVSQNDTILVDPSTNSNVGPDTKIIIPKLNVNVPVVYDVTALDDTTVQKALERGVVHYKLPGANSIPGQSGNTVILGHSSNDVFDPGSYKFAFVLLDRLQNGDVFYLHYDSKRYIYRVTDRKVISPSDFGSLQTTSDKPQAILVTCTPPGTALKRLLIYGEQISPDPGTAAKPAANSADKEAPTLPGNSQTFFERVWDFFF